MIKKVNPKGIKIIKNQNALVVEEQSVIIGEFVQGSAHAFFGVRDTSRGMDPGSKVVKGK